MMVFGMLCVWVAGLLGVHLGNESMEDLMDCWDIEGMEVPEDPGEETEDLHCMLLCWRW